LYCFKSRRSYPYKENVSHKKKSKKDEFKQPIYILKSENRSCSLFTSIFYLLVVIYQIKSSLLRQSRAKCVIQKFIYSSIHQQVKDYSKEGKIRLNKSQTKFDQNVSDIPSFLLFRCIQRINSDLEVRFYR